MIIKKELDLKTFEAWSGAEDTLARIILENKTDELEAILDDAYPDGMTEIELNDLLWFEPDTVFEWLGIRTEEQIKSDLEDAEEELAERKQYYEESAEDLDTEEEKSKLYADKYKEDIEELEERIKELKEELEEI